MTPITRFSDQLLLRHLRLRVESLSFLKVYNFDIENSVESFMLTVEEKLDMEICLIWEDKKAELRKENEMVTIQKLPPLKSEMDIKGSKHFLYKLTTNLSTLKVYNFDIENSVETFMLTIEEKLDRESSLKWEDKKQN